MSRFERSIVAPVALLAVSLLLSQLAVAEMLSAELRVHGLACPFCAFGIEKKLRDMEGVEEVEVLLDDGNVRVELAVRNRITLDALREVVSESGFQLAGLVLEVRGSVAADGEESLLDAGNGVRFRLLVLQEGHARPISRAALDRFRLEASEGSIQLRGSVETKRDGLPALLITSPAVTRSEAK